MFFTPGHANDDEYINLRDESHLSKDKERIEELYKVHEPYKDSHFLTEAKSQLHQRVWEMILTNVFIDRGYIPQKTSDGGPEFFIEISGKRFWVEAIAPGPGTGADAVPHPQYGGSERPPIPNEKIILRLTNAVDGKLKKYDEDKQKRRIRTEDGFILAVNGNKAVNRWHEAADDLPFMVKAVLPFGSQDFSWDTNTDEIVEGFAYRPEVYKEKGSPVSTCWLQKEECKVISAIIYSEYGILELPQRMGSKFTFIHNRQASQPLNLDTFKFGRHYWLEGDQLKHKTYP